MMTGRYISLTPHRIIGHERNLEIGHTKEPGDWTGWTMNMNEIYLFDVGQVVVKRMGVNIPSPFTTVS